MDGWSEDHKTGLIISTQIPALWAGHDGRPLGGAVSELAERPGTSGFGHFCRDKSGPRPRRDAEKGRDACLVKLNTESQGKI